MNALPLIHSEINLYRPPDDRPVAIQFSGGRSSAYMLWHILQAYGGTLPAHVHVLFQNTGREMPATLDFVQAVSAHWLVPITWLEYTPDRPGFRIVGHNSASRNGEPFEAIIRKRRYAPNRVTRFCTAELKVRTARRYLITLGLTRWTACIGFRADEKERVLRMLAHREGRHRPFMPMAAAGVTKRDVADFWARQAFDLQLPSANGKTPLGNCDGCFLKSEKSRAYLARYHPERAAWWNRIEREIGYFTPPLEGSTWQDIIDFTNEQPDWIHALSDNTGPLCTDSFGGCFT